MNNRDGALGLWGQAFNAAETGHNVAFGSSVPSNDTTYVFSFI